MQLAVQRAERIAAATQQSIARSSNRVDQTLRRLSNSGARFDRAGIQDSAESIIVMIERWHATVEQIEIAREVRRTSVEAVAGAPGHAGRPVPTAD